jgi:tRNA threonylcarbamoyladenosine biosynthesis protein TsaB
VRVLAIETATTVCAAAVVSEGKILSEAALNEKYVHAEKLMAQVDAVLDRSGFSLHQFDGIAVSIGPGSFTGLRIGLSVAKGLSFALDKRIVPVPTLHALAQQAIDGRIARTGEYILAALDARRDEVYSEFFRVENGYAKSLSDPCDVSAPTLQKDAPEGKIWITGDAQAKLQSVVCAGDSRWSFVPDDIARCSAGAVGLLGEVLMAKNEIVDTASLEPLYIKEFFFRQRS